MKALAMPVPNCSVSIPVVWSISAPLARGGLTVLIEEGQRRDRITVRGRTKTEVKDKLRTKHTELAAGIL
jgi:hypothetical protein